MPTQSGSGERRILRTLERALAAVHGSRARPETATRQRAEVVLGHLSKIKAALLIANSRGRYIVVNPAAARLTGYSRDELLQLSVWDLTPSMKQSLGRRLWREFLKRGRMRGDYVLRRKTGRLVHAHYLAVADVLPGIHVSLLIRRRSARRRRKARRQVDRSA